MRLLSVILIFCFFGLISHAKNTIVPDHLLKNALDQLKQGNSSTLENHVLNIHPCRTEYFEYNAKNVKESGAAEYYRDRVIAINATYPDQVEQYGDMHMWAKVEFNRPGFECGVVDQCEQVPTCEEIYQHTNDSYPFADKQEIIDRARKNYFSVIKIVEINRFIRLIYVGKHAFSFGHSTNRYQKRSLEVVQKNIIMDLAHIIDLFTPQKDSHAEAKCAMIRAIESAWIDTTISMVGTAMGMPFGEFVSEETAKNIERGVNLARMAVSLTSEAIQDAKWAAKSIMEWREQDYYYKNRTSGYDIGRAFQVSMGNDDCMSSSYGRPDENFERLGQFGKWLAEDFIITRYTAQHLWNDLSIGGSNKADRTMYDWMSRGHIPQRNVKLKHMEETFEMYGNLTIDSWWLTETPREITQNVQHAIIATALTNSKCYVKCNDHTKQALHHCKWNKKSNKGMAPYRFCEAGQGDAFGNVCQIQCWSAFEHGTEIPLYRAERLQEYNLTALQILKNSVEVYRKYNNFATPGGINPIRFQEYENTPTAFLPVCSSHRARTRNFLETAKKGTKIHTHDFPSSCGDRSSSDSKLFMERLLIMPKSASTEADYKKIWWMFQYITPRKNRNWTPLEQELMYCELGMRWPLKDDGDGQIVIQANSNKPTCAAVKEKVKDMTVREANLWWCGSEHFRDARNTERHDFQTKGSLGRDLRHVHAPWTKCSALTWEYERRKTGDKGSKDQHESYRDFQDEPMTERHAGTLEKFRKDQEASAMFAAHVEKFPS